MRLTCVTIDCADPERVASFWAEALGWSKKGSHRVEPPSGVVLRDVEGNEFCLGTRIRTR